MVAARLASTSVATSIDRPAFGARVCTTASAPVLSARPTPKTASPCSWCCSRAVRPRTPKVKERLTAVLPTAVISSAIAFAHAADIVDRRTRKSAMYAIVLAMPTPQNRNSCAPSGPLLASSRCARQWYSATRRGHGSAGRCREDQRSLSARCRRASLGRRSNRPAPRESACLTARPVPAVRCQRTSRCLAPSVTTRVRDRLGSP